MTRPCHLRLVLVPLAMAAALAGWARAAPAQEVRDNRLWEPPGFDFPPDGVWRPRARQVALNRSQALARGDFALLNAPMALRTPVPSALAVAGILNAPAILFRFRDSDTTALRDTSAYTGVLFSAVPAAGKPYTVRTFYEELSNGLFSLRGASLGWVALDSNEARYVGPATGCTPYGTCNGIWSSEAFQALSTGLAEAALKLDQSVDFGRYDNDGPNGIPNSGDDDGVVDLVLFLHPSRDGACRSAGNNHPWSHRSSLGGLVTNDPWTGHAGQFIRIGSYIMQSGVGGSGGCDSTAIMPIGTTAHELGHGLGLPDLYDTNPNDSDDSEGIGHWGLMGSGNQATQSSPSHMESWSRSRLGWITVRALGGDGTYSFGPSVTRDTVFLLRPSTANAREEFFLLENRQGVLSDTALVRLHGPGLLLWHADSAKFASGGALNSGAVHALWLRQADGLDQLRSPPGVQNRGDAGDPYPGSTGNTRFAFETNPAAILNAGGFTGFVLDSIRQVVTRGEMAFRLRFGALTLARASDTTAQVLVRGTSYTVFREVFADGDTATISVDSVQLASSGRTRFLFRSWSDGLARTHLVSTRLAGDTFIATVRSDYLLKATARGNGTVSSTPTGDLAAGTFLAAGDTVRLTATPAGGQFFEGWSGDTSGVAAELLLRMTRPFELLATFNPLLATTDTMLRGAVMGAPYADTLTATGGMGSHTWSLRSGTLPPGLSLSTSGIVSGTPTRDSSYAFTLRVASGVQALDRAYSLTVTAPALALDSVVSRLLTGSGLAPTEINYLDLVGNRNGRFDVGDFRAWLDRTGVRLAASGRASEARGPR